MPYLVTKQTITKKEITLDDILNDLVTENMMREPSKFEYSGTRTYFYKNIAPEMLEKLNINKQILILETFYEKYKHLDVANDPIYNYPRQAQLRKHLGRNPDKIKEKLKEDGYEYLELYDTAFIPKKKGGLRQLDIPNHELLNALSILKNLLESLMNGCYYHTSAFAYVKGRSPKDAVVKHQKHCSRWFLKLDFSNFFGSVTIEFLMNMMANIYPFSEIVKKENGKKALYNCLHMCFLGGGLPQGVPTSPILTNIMMIPIDHKLTNALYKHKAVSQSGVEHGFVYSRYADDLCISNRINFDHKEIEDYVVKVLKTFNAPFSLNKEKTQYGNSNGQNWMLGVMLNKDNEITIGYKRKKHIKGMLTNYILDRKNGIHWDKSDIYAMSGELSYASMIEADNMEYILNRLSAKYGDIREAIRTDLKSV